jgi:hypothetical protein
LRLVQGEVKIVILYMDPVAGKASEYLPGPGLTDDLDLAIFHAQSNAFSTAVAIPKSYDF